MGKTIDAQAIPCQRLIITPLLSLLIRINLVQIWIFFKCESKTLIKNYILQLFTNRLSVLSRLLFNYRILSETIQARIIRMSLDFMCTLIPSSAGIFFAFNKVCKSSNVFPLTLSLTIKPRLFQK